MRWNVFWMVVWIVLMILWLFCGAWPNLSPSDQPRSPVLVWGGMLIPWICVAILGYMLFGGHWQPVTVIH